MADFKDELSPTLVARLAGDIADVSASFGQAAFVQLAETGLSNLELKARIDWIARALSATMPPSPEDADQVIRAALANGGLEGWASMPVNAYVASAMINSPDIALPLLAILTPRYTAEFAIRPFIDAHYDLTMEHLRSWTTHPDEHVRRLVSEGTRPRLPWAGQLSRFIADPAPALALLEPLVDDDSLYVRRSVANHLNDITKDHPHLALQVGKRWSLGTTHGDFVVRHGLRTLIKRGDPQPSPSSASTAARRSRSPTSSAHHPPSPSETAPPSPSPCTPPMGRKPRSTTWCTTKARAGPRQAKCSN